MADGRLLAAGYSSDYYYEWDDAYDRLPQLLRFNTDGSLDRKFDVGHVTIVCSGVAGLLLRADGSLLIGDDTGIYASLDGAAQQTFGVGGTAADEYWQPHAPLCTGMRSFATDQAGKLMRISAVALNDSQLGFVLDRLNDDGTKIEPSEQAPPVPLARLVGADAQFTGLNIPDSSITLSRPVESAADERVYVLFGFDWGDSTSADNHGKGWAIARFALGGLLDTGWGEGGVVVLGKRRGNLGITGNLTAAPTLLEPLPDGRVIAMSGDGVLTRLVGGQREGHGAINIEARRDFLEDAGQISLEVTRTGGTAAAVSVEYSTTVFDGAGAATSGADFTAVSGRLDWADGDNSPREIAIPILQDSQFEGPEQFAVDIRSPSANAVLLNSRIIMKIADDDTSSTPPPPTSQPPPPPQATASSGGGAADGLTLAMLFSLVAASVAGRRRARRGLPEFALS
jgi:hypothetical protein